MIVQVRMPPRLVQLLDRMAQEGIYASRSEAILDSVRRLAIGYERSDRFKRALIRSYLGKKGPGSVDDLAPEIDPLEIASAIRKAFNNGSIDEIITEVRR